MKQFEAVIAALEKLGGQATLAQLYVEATSWPGSKWGTKTPYASVRRIVQERPEIFKIRPGLWALESRRAALGLERAKGASPEVAAAEQDHAYFQGLLAVIGNLRGFGTFIPNQDKNRVCLSKPLAELRSLQQLPLFTYGEVARRAATVDVSWFNDRRLPHSFFEVEHSTDMQNSLLKFYELQDFHARMVIVASDARRREFTDRVRQRAFEDIAERIAFYEYEQVARDYDHAVIQSESGFAI